MTLTQRNAILWRRAQECIPGGVNSPVRAFKAVGGTPVFIKAGRGPILFDEENRSYIDFVGSWGPLILGHAHPAVVKVIGQQATKGTSFGAVTRWEVELAELIREAFGHIQKVRLTSSGTEAAMSAVRLARAVTGRALIVKIEGGYHGHSDGMLVKAGSGGETFGIPDSAGVSEKTASETLTIPYNDAEVLREMFSRHPGKIAALILEPVMGNMGLILPEKGYLQAVREICSENGALLIFDEVITGFRLCFGGADKYFGVTPDITVLGKIIGGGMPIGAFGGPARVMDMLAPLGPVYQAGTLSGNPVAVRCGVETLKILKRPGVYKKLEDTTGALTEGLKKALEGHGIVHRVHQLGSMFCVFFSDQPVRDAVTARKADAAMYRRWFWELLKRGVYFPGSAFETCFVSLAHGSRQINASIRVFEQAAAGLEKS